MKKHFVLALGLALAAGACTSTQSQSVVLVSVTADADLPTTTQLRATLTGAGISSVEDFPQVNSPDPISFTPAATFALVIPRSHTGDLHVLIDARDATSQVVGRGEGTVTIDVGGRADVAIVLHRVQPGTGGAGGNGGSAGSTSPGTSGPLGTGGTPGSGGTDASGGRTITDSRATLGGSSTAGASAAGGASGGTSSSAPPTDVTPSPGCSATPTMTSTCSNTSSKACTITVKGIAREYYLNLPTTYDGKKPVPVVWEYHPLGGNGKSGITMYGLNTRLPNVIFVSPHGLGENAGFPNSSGQDEAMTRAINAEIEAKYCIDTSRYFATGFNYGGGMAYTAACNMSDIFRAVAAMSGANISGATCASKKPTRMVAVWATHGAKDTVLSINAATPLIQALVKYNGCSTTTTAVNPTPCVSYQGCQTGYPVVWCLRPEEDHAMPSFAPAAIADFFKQYF